jgi:hypothetical protein
MIVNQQVLRGLFQGIRGMRESVAYDLIMDEGRVEEAQKMILRQGRIRWGDASEETRAALIKIDDLDRLERMGDRVLSATSWQELLDTP